MDVDKKLLGMVTVNGKDAVKNRTEQNSLLDKCDRTQKEFVSSAEVLNVMQINRIIIII